MQARSIVPGRQRWDIGVVLSRPRVAALLEAELRESPGVGAVRANPVTGRLLVHHDTALSGEKVGQLIRKAVALAVRKAKAFTRSLNSKPSVAPAGVPRRHRVVRSVVLAGGTALALTQGRFLLRSSLTLLRSSLTRLGIVLAATVAVVRREWRKRLTGSQDEDSAVPLRSPRNPLMQIVGPHKRKFYLASFLSVLGQTLNVAIALLIGLIVSVPITGASAALVSLGLTSTSVQLWFLAGVTALVCAADAVVAFRARTLWHDLSQSVQHQWRTEIYAHIQRVELRYLEGERATRLARVLTEDINQLGRFFATSAHDLLQLGASFLFLVPLFLIFAPSIAWIAFLSVPIITWLSFYHHKRAKPDYAASSENGSLLNSQLINNLEASATVKSFCAEDYEVDHIHRLSAAYREGNDRIDTRTSAYAQIVRGCVTVSFVGFLLSGGLEVVAGNLSFVVFNPLIGLPMQIMWKLPGLGDAVDQYQRTLEALRRVLDIRSLPVESGGIGRSLDVAEVKGELVLDRVTFAYTGRLPILQNLSLRIAAGKTTGIVGVTGAGKTTIAKLLMRFQEVESGQVLLDGRDIRDVRLNDLRAAIGFVGQDAFLFDGSVGDNIRYGSFDADSERMISAARLAEVDSFVEALPSRYDTMVGERGVTLSGGQKQRISLARAIVKAAPILILDEATSALDNETEAAIQRALKEYVSDRTLVVIAHRLSTIRNADWIYVLGKGGVVVEEGTHNKLLEHDDVYASLWRLQTGEVMS